MDAYVRVEWKSLTSLEFEILWALLEAKELDPERHRLETVRSDESSWLFRFPQEYVDRLVSLSPEAVLIVGDAWARTEELQWPPEDAQHVLVELTRLARTSRETSRGLYLWGSL
jgi:hypothetical protein